MSTGILGLLSGLVALGLALFNYFKKSPEQKLAEDIQRKVDKDQDSLKEINDAVKKARRGRTSGVERIITRRK